MEILILYLSYAILLSVALGYKGFHKPDSQLVKSSANTGRRILIVGASGGTGEQLVRQALERGYTVTALVRNPKKISVTHPQMRLVRGDVMNYAAVEKAVQNQDVVISALGHGKYLYPTRILSGGTRNLVLAMEKHGVPRFICETSLGIGDNAGRLGIYYTFFVIPVILPFYYWDKTRQERIITGSHLDWVIVRPGILTNGKRRGNYRHGSGIGSFIGSVRISRADVADFMLNQIEDDTYLGQAPGVCR